MRLFKIEAVATGHYWERDVNCPSYWRGSGVYDVSHPCWQEVGIEIAAESNEEALEVLDSYESMEYAYNVEEMIPLKVEDAGEFEWGRAEIVGTVEGTLEEGKWRR